VKVRRVLRVFADDGQTVDRQRGSHRILVHPTTPGTVTVAGKPGVDVPPGTLARSATSQD